MATVLLAVEDEQLRDNCRQHLSLAGHASLTLERPLALLTMRKTVRWEALLVDGSRLGCESLAVAGQDEIAISLGEGGPGAANVQLPLSQPSLLEALSVCLRRGGKSRIELPLRLDQASRRAMANGREVILTRTEFRLLEYLLQRLPEEIPIPQLVSEVWGFSADTSTSDLVRVHIRNLRLKLQQIGLPDAIRSRRGRGYAFVV